MAPCRGALSLYSNKNRQKKGPRGALKKENIFIIFVLFFLYSFYDNEYMQPKEKNQNPPYPPQLLRAWRELRVSKTLVRGPHEKK